MFGMEEMCPIRRPQHLLTAPLTLYAGKSDIFEQSFEQHWQSVDWNFSPAIFTQGSLTHLQLLCPSDLK